METLKLDKNTCREVKRLVRKECCNCYEDNCLLLDDGESHTCPQLITQSHIICNYLRNCVLPICQPLLNRIKESAKPKMITCSKCRRKTERTGKNQKYCPDCAKKTQRRRNAEFMSKKRAESG